MLMPLPVMMKFHVANMIEHPYYRMKAALQEQGWYVAWAHPCCQTCAWHEVPFQHPDGPRQGQDVDFDLLLFNHEQDCNIECDYDEEADEYILPEGMTRDDYCVYPTYKPEQTEGSLFSFSGDEAGVQKLVNMIPVIESTGWYVRWNQTGNTRIFIGWNNEPKN